MVKRLFIAIIVSILVSASMFPVARAQEDGHLRPVDQDVFESVMIDCLDVKMRLSAVYQQDGLLRVNAGAAYDSITERLVARLNSKVASESLDGAELIAFAADIREGHEDFIASYMRYERAMNQLLKTDCQSRQHQYYQDLTAVRGLRAEVYISMNQTNQSIDSYFTAFEEFKQNYLKRQSEDESGPDEG